MECRNVEVSIIVPFYRGNQYIKRLFRTVDQNVKRIREKYENIGIELIIVNDSPEMKVQSISSNPIYSINIINHEKNCGIHKARVTGLLFSNGRYIAFLDQDDEWDEMFLVSQYEKLGMADVVVSNAWIEQCDGSKVLLYRSKLHFKNVLNKSAYIKSHNQITSPGQCLIRREAIPEEWIKFITPINGSDDLLLWLLMLGKGANFVLNEKALYIHRYTGGNLSAEIDNMNQSSLSFISCLKKANVCNSYELNAFERARNYRTEVVERNLLGRMRLTIRNFDLFLPRFWWKIQQKINKYNVKL